MRGSDFNKKPQPKQRDLRLKMRLKLQPSSQKMRRSDLNKKLGSKRRIERQPKPKQRD